MAIAYDNSASFTGLVGSNSFSYTVAANAYLFVVTTDRTSNVTYNGVNLLVLINFTPAISGGNTVTVWYMANPPTGAHNIGTTVPAAGDNFSVVSYTGIKGTVPEASNNTYSNNGVINTQVTSLSNSLSTIKNNSWAILFVQGSNNTSRIMTGTIGTLRQTNGSLSGGTTSAIIDSNGPISPDYDLLIFRNIIQ